MNSQTKPPVVPLAEFLESYPPGRSAVCPEAVRTNNYGHRRLVAPELELHCATESCNGNRFFAPTDEPSTSAEPRSVFIKYVCRNCGKSSKQYALICREVDDTTAEVYKVGEVPPFGPPVPARVISLVGPDRDLFIKGRRCENQDLGIGAFAYYRRVIENNWQRLISEIQRVADRTGAPQPVLDALAAAAKETQFAKAIDQIKEAVPEVLKIDGHNPLSLLHKALSEGIHEHPDEECLKLASSIRVVLIELAERVGQALKDDRQLKEAVTKLVGRKLPTA